MSRRTTTCRRRPATAPRNTILLGDALDQLRRLPDASVDTVVTSPPYFLLRNYAAAGQIGMEDTVEEFTPGWSPCATSWPECSSRPAACG